MLPPLDEMARSGSQALRALTALPSLVRQEPAALHAESSPPVQQQSSAHSKAHQQGGSQYHSDLPIEGLSHYGHRIDEGL